MRITTALSGSLLVLTLALAGCGDDHSGADDALEDDGPADVCALITTADLEEAFGAPFDEGELSHEDETGGDQCVWGIADAVPGRGLSIVLLRDGHLSAAFAEGGDTVKDLYEDSKESSTDAEEVDLGDDAYLSGTELAVLDGENYWRFNTSTATSPDAIDGMTSLAEKVVG